MRKYFLFVVAACAAALLIGCGGGKSSNVITGVAATGAPIANAKVFIKDANGNEPTGQDAAAGVSPVITDANGNYEFTATMMQGLTSPFIIRVVGTKVLDSGEDATAILHAVVASTVGATANITPLTEALTILTLGPDTVTSFNSPRAALANYTLEAAKTANDNLLAKFTLPAVLQEYDLVSGALDARPTIDLSNATPAKLYDILLDTIASSSSQGSLILSDRNRPSAQYVGGPRVTVTPGSTTSPAASLNRARMQAALPRRLIATGTLTGIDENYFLDSTKLQAFIDRFTTQLQAGCSVPLEGSYDNISCASLINPANAVFSSSFMDAGMTADKWLSFWVGAPLDIENLGDLTISRVIPYVGGYLLGTQAVTRVLMTFQRPNGDSVQRPVLLADDGTNITIFGDQTKYRFSIKPALGVNTDSEDTYPYSPKYQAGLKLLLNNWYAGEPNMFIGAHVMGPGLPVSRSTNDVSSVRLNFVGEPSNPNKLVNGVEIFERTSETAGCSSMPVDPSVYVERNNRSYDTAWSAFRAARYDRNVSNAFNGDIRWRPGNTTCSGIFDMRRYYNGPTDNIPSLQSMVMPKAGDSYTVTLYLDATKWGGAGQPALPDGAIATRILYAVNVDGDTIGYYPWEQTVTLGSDAFPVPASNATIPANLLPGVTDASRARLASTTRGADRLLEWTRNAVNWPERDGNNNEILTPFNTYAATFFQGSKDQMSSADKGYAGISGRPGTIPRGFVDYRTFFFRDVSSTKLDGTSDTGKLTLITTDGGAAGRLDENCGSYVKYKGEKVRVRVRRVSNPIDTTFPREDRTLQGDTNNRVYQEITCAKAQREIEEAFSSNNTGPLILPTWNDGFLGYTVTPAAGDPPVYVRYQYDVVRDRADYKASRFLQLKDTNGITNLAVTLTWAQAMSKERVGSRALCSSFDGAFPNRNAGVIMIDMNGRNIIEYRDVQSDWPGMTAADLANPSLHLAGSYINASAYDLAITNPFTRNVSPAPTRAGDISRPNYLTDGVYLPITFDVQGYELNWTIPSSTPEFLLTILSTGWNPWNPFGNKWHAQPGIIQPAYEKASAGATTCTPKIW